MKIFKTRYRIHHDNSIYLPWCLQRRQWFLFIPWWHTLKSFEYSEEALSYIDKLKSVDMMNKYI